MKKERQFHKRKLFEQIGALHVKSENVSLQPPIMQAHFSAGWVRERQKIAPSSNSPVSPDETKRPFRKMT